MHHYSNKLFQEFFISAFIASRLLSIMITLTANTWTGLKNLTYQQLDK